MKHIFNKKYIIANIFSRRFQNFLNNINEIHEENIDDFIDEQLNYVRVYFVNINEIEKKLLLKKIILKSHKKSRDI